MLKRALAVVMVIFGVFAAADAFAQGEVQKGARTQGEAPAQLPAWILSCSNANAGGVFQCAMEQTLYVSATSQRVVSLRLARTAEDKARTVATLSLPHGILLTEGVTFWVDDGPKTVAAITRADAAGSYGSFQFEDDLASAFKKGVVLHVSAKSLNGEDFVVDLSLSGFSAAYDKMISLD